MTQDQHLMNAYKEYAKSLGIQKDLTQIIQRKISDTKPRFKLKRKPAYILAFAAVIMVVTGFTLLMEHNINLKTGEVTREAVGRENQPVSEETYDKLTRIAKEIEPTIPKGQYAIISAEEAGGDVNMTVYADGVADINGAIKDEAVFKSLCQNSEVYLPTLSSYDGLKYAYGYVDNGKSPQPERVEAYDANTTISYFSTSPDWSVEDKLYGADGYYENAQKDTIWIYTQLFENSDEIRGTFSDSTQVSNLDISGWDYAIGAENQTEGESSGWRNTVMLGKAIDSTTYITVSIRSETTPLETLIDIAANIE